MPPTIPGRSSSPPPNRDELAGWFSARLKRPVGVPDLSGSGYRLMGGRLVATQQGPAGLLMYDDGHGARFVMLMRPMSVPGDAPMRAARDRYVERLRLGPGRPRLQPRGCGRSG